jgi:DNA-binding NtrC family response regulator
MKGSKPKILLVDSDLKSRVETKKLLEKHGYWVNDVEAGGQALRFLTKDSFDLVISEAKLPDISGTELMRRIRSIGTATDVIFFTACGDWETYVDLMNMGAFNCLAKSEGQAKILL